MKRLPTYLFITSFFVFYLAKAQEESNATSKKEEVRKKISARDTLPPSEKYGLRIGIDAAKYIRSKIQDTYTGIELLADYRVSRKFYIAAEAGKEDFLREESNITARAKGNYLKFGMDYNAYKNWYGMQNSIFVGLRYGYAQFDQTLLSYRVFTSTDDFTPKIRTQPTADTGLTSGWIELVLGVKVELFFNLFLSGTVSVKNLLHEKTPPGFDNLFIPGFGKTNDFTKIGVGYGYTLTYLIPFVKKKR